MKKSFILITIQRKRRKALNKIKTMVLDILLIVFNVAFKDYSKNPKYFKTAKPEKYFKITIVFLN
jgi:hypothetical protein